MYMWDVEDCSTRVQMYRNESMNFSTLVHVHVHVEDCSTRVQMYRNESMNFSTLVQAIDQFIRLCSRRTCEQEHVSLYNAILYISATRAKHTRMHVSLYLSDFWLCNGL